MLIKCLLNEGISSSEFLQVWSLDNLHLDHGGVQVKHLMSVPGSCSRSTESESLKCGLQESSFHRVVQVFLSH